MKNINIAGKYMDTGYYISHDNVGNFNLCGVTVLVNRVIQIKIVKRCLLSKA